MKIKNWDNFQHFKDRNPPWIKLHKTILDQRDISVISDCSFRVLIGLWLLASEDHTKTGTLPEIDDIAFRLRIDNDKLIKALHELKSFLVIDDIDVISARYQDDEPETETETETEEETEEEAKTTLSGNTKKTTPQTETAIEILDYLNTAADKNFKPTKVNLGFVIARLNENHSPEDIFSVIDMKVKKWKKDKHWNEYLRPATLFNATKFNQYVGEIRPKEMQRTWMDDVREGVSIFGDIERTITNDGVEVLHGKH